MVLATDLVVIKLRYSLRNKLSVSYLLVALVTVFLIVILTNLFLDQQFKVYVQQNQAQRNQQIVASIRQQYQHGQWNVAAVGNIGVDALGNGLIVRVKDAAGTTLWDARTHNNGQCQHIIAQMSELMGSRYPDMDGGYAEKIFPVILGGETVGQVVIGFYGPFYLTDADVIFIDTLNRLIIGIGIFCMLLAFGLGSIIARQLSLPMSRAVKAAQMIAQGRYDCRVDDQSGTREIGQLTSAVNELAENLQAQESLRKRLTGDVAHELRTPLATLQSHMEAMIDGIWAPDKERLTSCHEEILRLNRMVGDLELLSRYENENLILQRSSFDLTELARHLLRNFAGDLAQKKITSQLVGDEKIIWADRDKLSQVLINLIANALKYTTDGGQIMVSIDGDREETTLSVKDNGIGMAAADLAHIFERFYRVDQSRSRGTGGSGIGLTIVKAIVEAHGGRITVASVPGQGTEFTVQLPNQVD